MDHSEFNIKAPTKMAEYRQLLDQAVGLAAKLEQLVDSWSIELKHRHDAKCADLATA